MSLFERVGRKFEETKRALVDDGDAEFVCRACEEPVAENHDHCPHCGEAAVESVS